MYFGVSSWRFILPLCKISTYKVKGGLINDVAGVGKEKVPTKLYVGICI